MVKTWKEGTNLPHKLASKVYALKGGDEVGEQVKKARGKGVASSEKVVATLNEGHITKKVVSKII
jgi:hypothetical protein